MKLQSNQNGAWRTMVEYPIDADAEVRAAAFQLALAAGHCTLRTDEPDGTVAATWSAREGWREYPFRRSA